MPLYLVGDPRTGIAIAICDRCRMKRFQAELSSDPNAPGLKVCGGCRDLIDPYRLPARAADPLVLRFARPDVDLSTDGSGGMDAGERIGIDFAIGESAIG